MGLGLLRATRALGVWRALAERLGLVSVRESRQRACQRQQLQFLPQRQLQLKGKATSPQNTDAHLTSRDFVSGR